MAMSDSGGENSFREYLTSVGATVHPDLALLADDPGKGRKVVVNADIASGTELLKIPINICFYASPTGPAKEVNLGHLSRKTHGLRGNL